MKKVIITAAIIVLVIMGLLVYIFLSSTKEHNRDKEAAIKVAKEVAEIIDINEVYIFNGKQSSATVLGRNSEGEEKLVFINYDENNYTVKNYAEGISKQEAYNIVKSEKNPQKIVSVKLGIEKGLPLWEVYYKTETSQLNYYYLNFYTGEWHKKIENL